MITYNMISFHKSLLVTDSEYFTTIYASNILLRRCICLGLHRCGCHISISGVDLKCQPSMADATPPQDTGLSSAESHPQLVSKTVKALRTALAGVTEQEEALKRLERSLAETKRENEDAKQRIKQLGQRLRVAEDKVQSAALTRCDLAAALLQRFTCSGDLDMLISTLTNAPPIAKESEAGVLSTLEKSLLVVHRLEPPKLSGTIAAAAAAAAGNSVATVAATVAGETSTFNPPKVEPSAVAEPNAEAMKKKNSMGHVDSEAKMDGQEQGIVARKRRRDSKLEERGAISVRTWYRGSGVRTRKSSRSSKMVF